VTVKLESDGQVLLNGLSTLTLTFTGLTPQVITLTAVNDTTVEGPRTSVIRHTITSNKPVAGTSNYDGIHMPDIEVRVIDNDAAGVLVQQSDGSTRVIEAGATLTGTPFSDSYTVVLTKQPTSNVTIHVDPAETPTAGSLKENFVGGPSTTQFTLLKAPTLVSGVMVDGLALPSAQFSTNGQTLTLTPTAPLREGAKIKVTYRFDSGANPTDQVVVSVDGSTYAGSLDLVFTPANWNTPQTVYVRAIDDNVIDGDLTQAFAPQPRTLDGIRGPLTIQGGTDPEGDTAIPAPVLYVAELDTPSGPGGFVPSPNSNLLVSEPEQVDVLVALNTDDVADGLGTMTDSRIYGFGMGPDRVVGGRSFNGGITYANIELLRLDLGTGSDRLLIDSTHGAVTIVNANKGNDQIHVRTVAGPTTINGERGDDTINVGLNFDATRFGLTIDHVNAPPLGVLDRIRANLRVDGGLGSDTVSVDDSGDPNSDVGILTGSTLDGLDLAASAVQAVAIEHAVGGKFKLKIGAQTTSELDLLAGAATVKAALLALNLGPHVTDVVVNRAGDVFTIGFVGDEQMQASALTIVGDLHTLQNDNSGSPTAITVTPWANGLTQAVDVRALSGQFTVTVGATLASFMFTVGAPADDFRNALIAAINSLPDNHPNKIRSADGILVGVKDVVVDKVGSTYFVVYQGLLRGLIGDTFALSVPPNSAVTPVAGATEVMLNTLGGTFTLTVDGKRTYALAGGASAAQIQAALNSLSGISGVAVTEIGGVAGAPVARKLRVTGLPGPLSLDDRSLDNPILIGGRRSGINYAVDILNVDLGPGNDVFNVRGTTAVTNLFGHNGNERYYVSAIANETLASAATTDFLEGDLDDIRGNFNLHAGTGRHLLFISDEASVTADNSVAITDTPVTSTRLPGAEIEIRGMSVGPITYQATLNTGNFADGITMWAGYGNDVVSIDGTHQRDASVRTITTLNTGLGDDTVTATLTAGQDGFFVLNTQGPYNEYTSYADADKLYAQASTLSLIAFGGQGNDVLVGGQGDDLLFGDRGRVLYFSNPAAIAPVSSTLTDAQLATLETTAVSVLGHGGHLDKTDGVARQVGLAITVDRTVGGSDKIYGNGFQDVLIGGAAGDFVDGGTDKDLIFGDNVALQRRSVGDLTSPRFRTVAGQIYSTDPASAGNLLVDSVFRADPSVSPRWNDLLIMPLDHDLATQAAGLNNFGDDYIAGGPGNDMIFGELGNDTIQGDGSVTHDLTTWQVAGTLVNAYRGSNNADRSNWLDPSAALTVVASVDNASDGDDYVEGGGGKDLIFGNQGQDDLIGGSSDLFGLASPARRPDDSDLIFGGSGTHAGRSDLGTTPGTVGTIHALDSDVIAGDNADILRLVAVSGATTSFRSFGYDNYSLTGVKIVVRAVALLDYHAGGADFNTPDSSDPTRASGDIGAADEVHGENGDDFMYGMVGNDVLYGDAQNDTIIGGYGADWISGGTGDDGILGDDGRLFASRVGTAEPLYGLGVDSQQNQAIADNSKNVLAVINVTGALRYTADLTPNNLVPGNPAPGTTTPRPLYANDVIFGGLGSDAIHGGAGDDALSGAEAPAGPAYANVYSQAGVLTAAHVQSDFTRPYNPGNLLGYSPTTTIFAQFDANDPLRKITLNPNGSLNKDAAGGHEWFLNFDSAEGPTDTYWVSQTSYAGQPTDGDDVLFGDLGHDWLVGGSGRDQMFAGWGDDLMNSDDKLTTNSSLTTVPDTNPSYEDLEFGGAGRDVLIGNTGGDRFIDWNGEFNTYLTPFAPFGLPTVIKLLSPGLPEFLYALSKSSGADQTLGAQYGGTAARNGEPFGELGLILTPDAAWGDQQGSPRDPQSGNIPGGARDVRVTSGKRDIRSPASTVNLTPAAETAAAVADPAVAAAALAPHQLDPVVATATRLWLSNGLLDLDQEARVEQVPVEIASLDGLMLGLIENGVILIDSDAAGWGWNVSGGTMDLLTVVLHELGHAAGLVHDADGLMAPTLSAGVAYGLGAGRAAPAEAAAASSPGRPAAAALGPPAIGLHVSRIHPTWPTALRPQVSPTAVRPRVSPPGWAAISRRR
jgi:Ca2+-binding RTX toxin-like protein